MSEQQVTRVAAAIIYRDGAVLAAYRNKGMQGWEFPGGHIEAGEDPAAAAVREVQEELNYPISINALFTTVNYEYEHFCLQMEVYLAQPLPQAQEPHCLEHRELRWCTRDELLDLEWLPADNDLVMQLALSWDQLFSEMHL